MTARQEGRAPRLPANRWRAPVRWAVIGTVAAGALLVPVGPGFDGPDPATPASTAAQVSSGRGPEGAASTGWPDPARAVCGARALEGPSAPPADAVVVRRSDDLASVTEARPPGTTFWLEPGVHRLGDGAYHQVLPRDGNRYVGAAGAVLDGGRRSQYAFGGSARSVRIEHLTILGFGLPGQGNDEGVVNHDGATGWTMARLTVRGNAGAGIRLGDENVVEGSCLVENGQYGFSAYSPDGVRDVTVRGNEIAKNNTDDWERRRPGCGCSGGGKFWDTRHAVVVGNHVHHNAGVGLWADTNNAGFLLEGNHIADNDGPGILYETSYNATIRRNTFVRNGLRSWRETPGFPTGAVYVSESGSDRRVRTDHADAFLITDNLFVDNWGGVVAWENADRFAGSPANTSSGASTLVDPTATVQACSNPELVRRPPLRDDCRWKTQHLRVRGNVFRLSASAVGPECTPQNLCGYTGVFSNYGTYPSWSPYQGTVVEEAVTFAQDNVWSDNTYVGPWHFMALEQGRSLTWAEWRAEPFGQDHRSTLVPGPRDSG